MTERRRRRLLAALVLVVGAMALVGVTAWRLATVAEDLEQAESLLQRASDHLTDGRLGAARADLEVAEELVLRASSRLRSAPELGLIGWVPGVRQNLESLQDSVGLAAVVIHGGQRILAVSAPLESPGGTLEVSLSDGSVPLSAVTAARTEIERLAMQLSPSRRGDSNLLVPQVRAVHRAVHDEAALRRGQLGRLDHGLRLLDELVGGDGPRRYLLAVANTAEMRGSGGMILNYGVLEGANGSIELTDFGRVDELQLSRAVPADLVPADYLARWNGFDPLSRLRQANLAGEFPVVAPVLEAMYTAATGLPVNGVIQIDPQGLAALLDGVGPVVVPELGEVRSDNVVALTLNEAYIRFPDLDERVDALGDVAEAAFQRLVDGDFPSLRPLAESIAEAVEGRHIIVHTTSRRAQVSVVAFGADGAYPPVDEADSSLDAFALTAQNLAGNKLDYYLDTGVTLSGERLAGELGAVDAEITLSNTAPPGATVPRYIFGPGPGAVGLPAGTLRSLVTLYLPPGSSLDGSGGDATVEPVSSGTEDGRPYVSFIVDVPAGQQRSVALSLQLPPRAPGDYELLLLPSPRIRPTTATVELVTEAGTVQGGVELDRRWVLSPGADPRPVVAPVSR